MRCSGGGGAGGHPCTAEGLYRATSEGGVSLPFTAISSCICSLYIW
jgi:hypothetical protein